VFDKHKTNDEYKEISLSFPSLWGFTLDPANADKLQNGVKIIGKYILIEQVALI